MQLRLKEHWKLVALGLALLVAIAFIVVSVISDSSDAAWPKQKTGGPIVEQGVVDVDLSDPPQQAWELDVRALTDNPGGDVLLSMPSTLDSYYGYGNTYQVGDVLVAATAYPLPMTDESSSSQGVGAVTLVGVNPDDGSPLWKTRIGGVIGQCSQQNESTIIACWGDRRMIFVDTATGTLMSDLGTDFDLNGATIAGDTVYTSGERMDGTVRTRILASGTTTNLTANFVRTFEPSEKFGAVYTVPHTDTVIAMEQATAGGTRSTAIESTICSPAPNDSDSRAIRLFLPGTDCSSPVSAAGRDMPEPKTSWLPTDPRFVRYRFPRTHRRPTRVSPRRRCRCFSATAPTIRSRVTNSGAVHKSSTPRRPGQEAPSPRW